MKRQSGFLHQKKHWLFLGIIFIVLVVLPRKGVVVAFPAGAEIIGGGTEEVQPMLRAEGFSVSPHYIYHEWNRSEGKSIRSETVTVSGSGSWIASYPPNVQGPAQGVDGSLTVTIDASFVDYRIHENANWRVYGTTNLGVIELVSQTGQGIKKIPVHVHVTQSDRPVNFVMPVNGNPEGIVLTQEGVTAGLIRHSSPTLVDLNRDGLKDIVIGTVSEGGDGVLAAIDGKTMSIMWLTKVNASGGGAINSTAAADDIDGDGYLEVVVGLGGEDICSGSGECRPIGFYGAGGIAAYNHDGTLLWRQDTLDRTGVPMRHPGWSAACPQNPVPGDRCDGLPDGVFSSPAIEDVNQDGVKDVAVGAWDVKMYLLRGDTGAPLPAAQEPLESESGLPLAEQSLGYWPLEMLDTIWSSPSLVDIDADGWIEMVFGGDLSANATAQTQDGGLLRAMRHDGSYVTGGGFYDQVSNIITWAHGKYVDQVVWSSPTVVDLDGDGDLEAVVGSGHNFGLPRGMWVKVFDHLGNDVVTLPTDNFVFSSPAVADLNGDQVKDIIAITEGGVVYAWDGATFVELWRQWPENVGGVQNIPTLSSPIVADINGDGVVEVLFGYGNEVCVLRGTDGAQLTATALSGDGRPTLWVGYTVAGVPAVDDIDGDGQLEIIVGSAFAPVTDQGNPDTRGHVYIWRWPGGVTEDAKLPWPMFRREPTHSGNFAQEAQLHVDKLTLDFALTELGNDPAPISVTIRNLGNLAMNWSAFEALTWLNVNPPSGQEAGLLQVCVGRGSLTPGQYAGTVTIDASEGTKDAPTSLAVSFEILEPAAVSLDTTSMNFELAADGSIPEPQNLVIQNSGEYQLSWYAEADVPWVGINPAAGQVAPQGTETVQVWVDTQNQMAGVYSNSMRIMGANSYLANSPQHVDIAMTLAPILALKPDPVKFMVLPGVTTVQTRAISIANVGAPLTSGPVVWDATVLQGDTWLDITPTKVAASGQAVITVDTSVTGVGEFFGKIQFSSSTPNVKPKTLVVDLYVGDFLHIYLPIVLRNYTAGPTPPPPATMTPIPTLTTLPTPTMPPMPTLTPIPSRLTYVSDAIGNTEIYTMYEHGTSVIRLTYDNALVHRPVWSHDGMHLLFTSHKRDNQPDIYRLDLSDDTVTNLTDHPDRDWSADWSPDGEKIVFQSDRDGDWEIYIMTDLDGLRSAGQLTRNPADDYGPSWSPDGSRIAFWTNRDGNFEIYTVDTNGSQPARLTWNIGMDASPAWSPDGTQIVFQSLRDGDWELFIIDSDGTDERRLTYNNGSHEQMPRWSEDGAKLAFYSDITGNNEIFTLDVPAALANPFGSQWQRITDSRTTNEMDPDWLWDKIPTSVVVPTPTPIPTLVPGSKLLFSSERSGNLEVYTLAYPVDGALPNQLTLSSAYEWRPRWSPDGTKILMTSLRGGKQDVYVMNIDGSNTVNLTFGTSNKSWVADWSPDGSQIVFQTNRDNPADQENPWEIYVMDMDGSNPRNITNTPDREDWSPVWGATDRIVYWSDRDASASYASFDIYSMKPDGSDVRQLTHATDGIWNASPAWSPDGNQIAFQSTQDGNWEIYRMNADGSNVQRLTYEENATDEYPCWSADGTKIVFQSNRSENIELYAINADDGSGITQLTSGVWQNIHPDW